MKLALNRRLGSCCCALLAGSLFVTLPPGASAPAGTPGTDKEILIRGRFFDDTPQHPLFGALVVVYDATSGLMQDQTYTTQAGEFVLRLPKPGEYYIVATKDALSGRRSLRYQTGAEIPPIDILSTRGHRSIAEQLLSNPRIQSVLGFAAGLLSGILGAILKQWYDNHSLFRVQIGQIRILCGHLSEKRNEISNLNTQQKGLPANDPREELKKRFAPLHRSVCGLVSQLELRRPDAAVVYAERGRQGYSDLLVFQEALSNLKDMITVETPLPEQWDSLLDLIDRLLGHCPDKNRD